MLSLRNVLALTATLFLVTATTSYGSHDPQATHKQNNSSSTAAAAHTPNTSAVLVSHASAHANPRQKHSHAGAIATGHNDSHAVALADIRRYASHHFAGATERSHTFHTDLGWARDWELHWIDYSVDHHVVRLYHAIHKHDAALRFTSVRHHTHGQHHGWRQVD